MNSYNLESIYDALACKSGTFSHIHFQQCNAVCNLITNISPPHIQEWHSNFRECLSIILSPMQEYIQDDIQVHVIVPQIYIVNTSIRNAPVFGIVIRRWKYCLQHSLSSYVITSLQQTVKEKKVPIKSYKTVNVIWYVFQSHVHE